MGKRHVGLRGALAAAITAATLLAGGAVGIGTAEAAGSTAVTGKGSIQITNVQGQRTYSAIKLAGYTAVDVDDSASPATINQISLDEDSIPASLETVLKTDLNSASGNKFPATGSDAVNPMTWVAQHWLGYPIPGAADGTAGSTSQPTMPDMVHNDTTSGSFDNNMGSTGSLQQPYSGRLREFVNKLDGDSTFQGFFGGSDSAVTVATATSSFGKDGSDGSYDGVATFNNLDPGMYLIEETTDSSAFDSAASTNGKDYTTSDSGVRSNSIPMLIGSTVPYDNDLGVAQLALSKFSQSGVPDLGTIKAKDDEVSVSQTWMTAGSGQDTTSSVGSKTTDVPLGIGDTVWLNVVGKVPVTNGFQHYDYRIIDKPTSGLELSGKVHFKIGTTEEGYACEITSPTDSALSDGSCTSGVYYYQYAANDSQRPDAKNIEFIFPNMTKENAGKKIDVDFSLKLVSNDGHEENRTAVAFSNDINAQPAVNTCTSDNADPTCTQGVTRTNPTPEPIRVYFNTLRLDNVIKDENGAEKTQLTGAHFELYRVNTILHTLTPVKFGTGNDGVYSYAGMGGASDTPTDLATAGTADTANAIQPGQLKLLGLGGGTFEVKQTQKADGAIGVALAKFDVTVGVNGATGSTWSLDTSKDIWKLVSKHDPFVSTDSSAATHHNEIGWVDVKSVNTMSALPLTGGMGLILAIVLAVLLIGVIVGAAMLRRHVQLTHQK